MTNRSLFRASLAFSLCSAVILSLGGCSGGEKPPPLGTVHGVVKLAGKPVNDALVEFIPTNTRASMGRTDSSGAYDLEFDPQYKGASVGEHTVKISTKPGLEGRRPETIPLKYNEQTELKKTVKEGDNTIDFELTP